MSAITKHRTARGHLVAWFCARPETQTRAVLTPLLAGEGTTPPERTSHRQEWANNIRTSRHEWANNKRWRGRTAWRAWVCGGRLRRPGRPPNRAYSSRASSLRESSLTPSVLLQSGTHFDARLPLFAEGDDPALLTALPPWLDQFGSNDVLFASYLPSNVSAEGTVGRIALPTTGEE